MSSGSGSGLPLYTVRCRSAVGEVRVITEEEYVKRIRGNARTLKVIEDNCEQKAQIVEEMLVNPCSYVNLPKALKAMREDAETEQKGIDLQ